MEWKEVRLGDVCEIKHGFAYKGKYFSDTPTCDILVTPGNFTLSGGFKLDKPKFYNGPVEKDYILSKGDLIVTMTDLSKNIDTLGYSALVPEVKGLTFHHNQRIGLVENIANNVDKYFLYWIMRTPAYQSFIATHSSGTTVHHTSPKGIGNYVFKLPPLDDQRRIASILSTLDRKIELNNKINADLEEMAQAIFKNWFVDFEPFKDGKFVDSELGMIPEGWKVGGIFDIAEIFDKKRKPLSGNVREKMDKIYPYYGATSCMDYVDDYIFDGIYTLIGEDGSVVKENGLPYMQYVWGKMWVNNHAHILQGKNGYSTEMIHALLSITNIKFLVTGAVQAKLSQGNMQKILVAIPPKNVLDEIRPVIDNLYSKIRINTDENSRLSLLRDTLLPRLMSGELEVPE